MLLKAGFTSRTGKGSHSNWYHPLYEGRVTLSGNESSDAKIYLEKKVLQAIQDIQRKQNE
jgi:predicted RNA binding protein YcfA (HicA-like mRNA interferase family)